MHTTVTDADLADAFDRLANVQGHLRIPRWQSTRVATRLRAGPRAVNRGTRQYTVRRLYRLTEQAVRRTRRTCTWLGRTREEAEAAGMLVHAHVLGLPALGEARARALHIGGWIGELAGAAIEEMTA